MLQQPRSQEEAPCTRTQEVSWETLLNKGIKPSQILFYILQVKDLHHQENLVHKRGATFPKKVYLLKFPNSHERYDSSMGNLPLLILT
jgi:hypothetical protein